MGSQRKGLNPIKPVFPQVRVEQGETLIGNTPAGNMIVRRTVRKVVTEPLLNADGQRRYRVNAVGQPVVPMNRKVEYDEVQEYEKIAKRDGSVERNFHFQPDPEEKARQERAAKIRDTQARLAEILVDADVSPEALVAAIKGDEAEPEKVRGRKKAEA